MTKRGAINRYKNNIKEAHEGNKRFSMIYCKQGCQCYVGIRFDDVLLLYGQLKCVRNGHWFKMSMDLGNELEYMYWSLPQKYDQFKKKWEREDSLNNILN